MPELIEFKLNDKAVKLNTDGERMLLWVLRTDLGLLGTKYGCGEGFCGSCTVIINNKAERSCGITVGSVRGKDVITIEGLMKNGKLHPLQKAFAEHDALQCGYCTPGMIMNAYGLLIRNPNPSYDEIINEMENNLCRCSAHKRIVDAVQTASAKM
ncbi:MAG: ferredoxin [Ignavibacteriae bacterium HGW-Ignavibacteriae-3]|nr:MAG: ferredoxin [Ignavibacteriae bacterium HGW-Ignavibacteriae-3]